MDGGAVPDLTMRNQPEVRLSLSVAVAVCLIGAPSMAGARLAVKQLNARGGFLGRPVELLGRDGLSDPALVAAATRELIHAPGLSAITGLNDTRFIGPSSSTAKITASAKSRSEENAWLRYARTFSLESST